MRRILGIPALSLFQLLLVSGCAGSGGGLGLSNQALTRADGTPFLRCEQEAAVAFVNDAAVTVDTLTGLGVTTRAADNLIAGRPFATVRDLDDVRWVGPRTIEKLADHAGAGCVDAPDCVSGGVVSLLNDPSTDAAALDGLGVYPTARNRLLAWRDGADGVFGTADDNLFDDLAEVDRVPYVGSTTLARLTATAKAACEAGAAGTVDVIFSPQAWPDSHLARAVAEIDGATSHIDAAMYSISDGTVIEALKRAARRGVSIRLVFNGAAEHRKSPAGTLSASFEDAGIEVRWVNKVMHHKFAIFDGPRHDVADVTGATVMSGSGNWSWSAGTRYDENTLVIEDHPELILSLQNEFEHLWNHSRELVWNESIPHLVTDTVDAGALALADSSDVDVLLTSGNFKVYESSRYGWTFSRIRGQAHVVTPLVERIAAAKKSVHIASGHLRSRPVAEALLALHAARPEVDIRVLLDNQEYLSKSTHDRQVRELEACLAEATTELQRDDCESDGFMWSYALDQAGIPVRFKTYAYRWHYTYAVQMHHKYVLIDGNAVATGSYNLSANAEFATLENMIVLEGPTHAGLVADFEQNFASLWDLSRADGILEAYRDEVDFGTGWMPLTWTPVALDHAELTELKRTIRAACPLVDSSEYRTAPEAHRYCER